MSGAKIMMVCGTRPEAIKLAPVYIALRQRGVDVRICATGQHEQLARDALQVFGIEPYHDLRAMQIDQSMTGLLVRLLTGLEAVLASWKPNWVIVQGDTTSALAGALAAYYAGVKVGHVEAGLRTGDLASPHPEEGNRRMISEVATLSFAPTAMASKHLPNARIVGNTVVDALAMVQESERAIDGRYVLVTAHRRESFGAPLWAMCEAVKRLAEMQPETRFIFSVHPNPHVGDTIRETLAGISNIDLIDPPDYAAWINMIRHAWYVLTDSGGIQEEAPSFGVPVVVMRDVTERMEAVNAGFARLAGRTVAGIFEAANGIDEWRAQISGKPNPFGDGRAAERIAEMLMDRIDDAKQKQRFLQVQ